MKTNLDIFKVTSSESELSKSGVEFEFEGGVKFLVAQFGGANAAAVNNAHKKYYKPYARLIENDKLSKEKQDELMIKVFVDSCVKGWENVEIDGETPEFSKELCTKLFQELPELCDTLVEYASDRKNYRDESPEDLGN